MKRRRLNRIPRTMKKRKRRPLRRKRKRRQRRMMKTKTKKRTRRPLRRKKKRRQRRTMKTKKRTRRLLRRKKKRRQRRTTKTQPRVSMEVPSQTRTLSKSVLAPTLPIFSFSSALERLSAPSSCTFAGSLAFWTQLRNRLFSSQKTAMSTTQHHHKCFPIFYLSENRSFPGDASAQEAGDPAEATSQPTPPASARFIAFRNQGSKRTVITRSRAPSNTRRRSSTHFYFNPQ